MCGFVGLISRQNNFRETYFNAIEKNLRKISHRGPDGKKIIKTPDCILGHCILSIQGSQQIQNQPFFNDRYYLIFNGEILNLDEIKPLLVQYKDFFDHDDSDTCVLFYGLVKSGFNFLKEIDGFYTCMFYDQYTNKGFIARDPGGQKQLYYSFSNNSLQIASEIKGLFGEFELKKESAEIFKSIGYIPSPNTIFENINALCPGEIIEFNFERSKLNLISKEKIFRIKKEKFSKYLTPEEIKKLVQNKVQRNLVGNCKPSILLSGGMDSSIILYEASQFSQVNAYTASYDLPNHKKKKYCVDESYAKFLCRELNINHNIIQISFNKEDLLKRIDKSQYHMDQPHFIGSIHANFEVAEKIKNKDPNCKIVLTGNGGDELFLGYNRYRLQNLINKIYNLYNLIDNKFISTLVNILLTRLRPQNLKYNINYRRKDSSHISSWMELDFINLKNRDIIAITTKRKDLLAEYFDKSFKNIDTRYEECYGIFDLLTWIPDDSNVISDRAFASVGIEARSPFLSSHLYQDMVNKLNFSKLPKRPKQSLYIAYKDYFPEKFFDRKKWGWTSPVKYWLDCLGEDIIYQALNSDIIKYYFSEIKELDRPLNWMESWKILIFWRWYLVNKEFIKF